MLWPWTVSWVRKRVQSMWCSINDACPLNLVFAILKDDAVTSRVESDPEGNCREAGGHYCLQKLTRTHSLKVKRNQRLNQKQHELRTDQQDREASGPSRSLQTGSCCACPRRQQAYTRRCRIRKPHKSQRCCHILAQSRTMLISSLTFGCASRVSLVHMRVVEMLSIYPWWLNIGHVWVDSLNQRPASFTVLEL